MVERAGLRTAGRASAELSTIATGTGTGTAVPAAKPAATGKATSAPVKRLPANRQPTKAEIMAKVRKAGFDA
jgi:hypothetical protein